MSKKTQQIKEPLKNKQVEDQNDPYLKTLQKKVRNINKKLTEIQELEGRDNLKQEQIQKLKRKDPLIEERAKIQQFAAHFRQTYSENAAHYRSNQLKQLQILARALVIFHSGLKLQQHDKLSSLWTALENTNILGTTLNESILTLTNIFTDFSNDHKLQKSLAAQVEAHGNIKLESLIMIKQQSHSVKKQKQERKIQVKPKSVKKQLSAAKVQTIPLELNVQPKVMVEAHVTEIIQEVKPVQLSQEPKKEQKSTKVLNNQEQREKKKFKPKYEEKKPQENKEDQSESSKEESETRDFRNKQLQKLQEEGFIVVGKPKPKPKDSKELKEFHDQQHGKKFHPHHSAINH